MKSVKQKRSFRFVVLCMLIVIFGVVFFSVPMNAAAANETPNDSYTYWGNIGGGSEKKAVYSRPMYLVDSLIDSVSLNVEAFTKLSDIYCAKDGKIYLLDGGSSRVFILSNEYKLIKEIKDLTDNEETLDFTGAQGVFAGDNGLIYIADTENARVLVLNGSGELQKMIVLPESDAIPSDFVYRPAKIAIDSFEYMYVLSDGSSYGAVLYMPDGTLSGFYGSNNVTADFGQFLGNLWKKLFVNNAKRGAGVKKLPYQFTDLCIDNQNFVYTCTGKTDDWSVPGQIRKLSPGGEDISGGANFNFGDEGYSTVLDKRRVQDFCGIEVTEDGYIYALDNTYGRLFIYDDWQNLLTAFGGGLDDGNVLGSFKYACALTVNNQDVLVCDSGKNSVTIFTVTEYGEMVKRARALMSKGKYIEAKADWESVLKLDKNNQLAYSGLASAAFAENNFEEALSYARQGYNRRVYSQAFEVVRRDYISRNFSWIFLLVLLAAGGAAALMVYTTKRKVVLIKNEKARIMASTITHPFRSFSSVKYNHKGSVPLCLLLLALFYIFSVLNATGGGFLFVHFDEANFNSLLVLMRTVGLALLWVVVNWAVTALFEGKGKMKEIFIITCYSLIPVIISLILFMPLSNVLIAEEAAFLNLMMNAGWIYTLICLCIGSIVIHDFSFSKFIGTSVLTLIGIGLIVFIVFMVSILLQQFFGFSVTVFMESVYR